MTTTIFTKSVITDGYDPIFSFAESGDMLIVRAGVTLANQGDWAVDGRGEGELRDLTAHINGTVSAPGWAAVDAFTASIDLTVGATGRLESTGAMAFEASYGSSLANHGVLHAGRGFGVVLTDVTDATVQNWGTIFGEVGAIEFVPDRFPGSAATVVNHGTLEAGGGSDDGVLGSGQNQAVYSQVETTTIVNAGTIHAADRVGAGVMIVDGSASIQNTGTIGSSRYWGVIGEGAASLDIGNDGTISGARGALSLSRGADSVTNDGLLEGGVLLGGGNDVYHGELGRVTGPVWGNSGRDLLAGGNSADVLGGGSGNDTLLGGGGADTLTGAGGADRMVGGAGADVFRFAVASDAAGDRIIGAAGVVAFAGAGVAGGDRVDVSAIDADTAAAGQQHFSFGTTRGVGDLWAMDVGDVTHIRGNTTGGGGPEFDLAIHDGAGVTASDYAAIDFIL
ncbi:Ca2+-binding RTX toxin-like protein [Amaricoccus macauensis]|uniref:Ca2+-binding RTX toxin-like protein n=1 Tax=Amaricoccus macauensis TaxID=57001 RepID=A0A840SJW5_9RHOB|nr:calcium-binding protein [Amaricoccus macauensis]MBB5221254.1 Ca2+-binding RTX toxin-like protein [Amaricoccus macauensis]